MASFLVWMGRFLLFGLVLTQCFLFAFYPTKKSDLWYLTSLSYAPSVLTWAYFVLTGKAKLRRLSYIWGLYTIGLVVSTIIVFATVVDNMDKENEENRGRNRHNVERFLCAHYISAGQTSLQVQFFTVPEEGWFGQPKHSAHIKTFLRFAGFCLYFLHFIYVKPVRSPLIQRTPAGSSFRLLA